MSAPFPVTRVERSPYGALVFVALPGRELAPEDAARLPSDLLAPAELAHARGLAPRRIPSWIGGRVALRRALAEVDCPAPPALLPDERGAATMPPGFRGSISHKDQTALALAAPTPADGAHLGVDLELDVPPRVDIGRYVLTDAERARGGDADVYITLVFSLKEAVYKAIDPFVRRYVGFKEVEIELGTRRGEVHVSPQLREGRFAIEAWWSRGDGQIVSIARARRA